jgi:hypothetical protein
MLDTDWKNEAKNLLKGELARRGIKYEGLATKLRAIGINETAEAINAKINRGSFSFVFVLQCMRAIDLNELRLINKLEST